MHVDLTVLLPLAEGLHPISDRSTLPAEANCSAPTLAPPPSIGVAEFNDEADSLFLKEFH
jgi:hypothetical protein